MGQTNEYILQVFSWLQTTLATALVNIVIAAIIVLVGFTLAKFLGKLLRKLLKEIEIDKVLKIKKGPPLSLALSEIFSIVIYILTIIFSLKQLGVLSFALEFILSLFGLFALFSIILWFFDIFPNLYASLKMNKKNHFSVGDKIEAQTFSGKVIKISLKQTVILTPSGDEIIIPNYYIYEQKKLNIIKKTRF